MQTLELEPNRIVHLKCRVKKVLRRIDVIQQNLECTNRNIYVYRNKIDSRFVHSSAY